MKEKLIAFGMLALGAFGVVGAGDVNVSVDFDKPLGRKIRAINGGNVGPGFTNADLFGDGKKDFAALRVPITRLHDVPLGNEGCHLVDLHYIFPLEHADAQDPRNYCFAQTDDYIRNILDCGSQVLFRLGTSIEHSRNSYNVHPPKDFGKWADICVNVIRHYNDGWANGHRWNIRYWEIWNEPDIGKPMWLGSYADYCRLYEITSKKIKAAFPDVKVGGPVICRFHPRPDDMGNANDVAHTFLRYCREHNCPLDFFSWHRYDQTLPGMLAEPRLMRQVVDSFGFTQTELCLNEWHYWVGGFSRNSKVDPIDGLAGINAAVYATAVMTGWQDEPLDISCYYSIGQLWDCWGVWDSANHRLKGFYPLRCFAKMLDYADRVDVKSSDSNVRVLAGRAADGRRALLVSNFKSNAEQVRLTLKGAENKTFGAVCIDKDNNHFRFDVKVGPDGGCVLRGAGRNLSSVHFLYEREAARVSGHFFGADEGASIGVSAPAEARSYSIHKLPVTPTSGKVRLSVDMKCPARWGGQQGDGTTMRVGLLTAAEGEAKGRMRETLGEVGPDFNRGIHCFGMSRGSDGAYVGKSVGDQKPGVWYRYLVEYDLDAKRYGFKAYELGPKLPKPGDAGRLVGESGPLAFIGTISAESGPASCVALYAHGLTGKKEQSGSYANLSVSLPEGNGWKTVWSNTRDLGVCDDFAAGEDSW